MELRVTRRRVLGAMALSAGAMSLMAGTRWGQASDVEGTPPDGLAYPTGVDDLVLRIAYVGGFVPPVVHLSGLPSFSLYRDGRVITTGPQIEIFPPPALPNLQQSTISEEGIEAVLAAADEAGLIGQNREYDNATVADATTAVFTVQAGGRVTTVSAYALGFGDDASWSPEERRELAKLQRFTEQVTDLAGFLPADAIITSDEPYPVERLQVLAEPVSGLPPPDPNDPTQNQPLVDWPLARPLQDAPLMDLPAASPTPRCGVIEGDDAERLLPAIENSNTLTPWVSEGEEFRLSFRPLLPDEQGCPPRSDLDATPEV